METEAKTKKKFKWIINRKWCKLCGICLKMCPVENLSAKDGMVVDLGKCIGCRTCERFCPDFAIMVEEDLG